MNSMANIGSSIMNANRTYQKSSSIRSARTQKSFMTTDSHFTRDTFNDQFKGMYSLVDAFLFLTPVYLKNARFPRKS